MTTAQTNRIVVLLPREERVDGSGGAVATWVSHIQRGDSTTANVLSMADHNGRASTIPLGILDRVIRAAATLMAVITPWPSIRWQRALWLRGFWYVFFVARQFRQADVLYIHNRPRYALFARWCGFRGKIVLHMHNDPVSYFKGIRNRRRDLADYVVCCSSYVRDRAVELCAVPRNSTSVIFNGVEPAPITTLVALEAKLLFVGRLQPLKGTDIAIDVVARLREQGVTATLTIVGGTEPGLRSTITDYLGEIEARADILNERYGAQTVRFLGTLRHEKVLAQMEVHPILLAPSRVEEAFGMVIAEAISRGTVPIASNRGGIPELLGIAGLAPVPGEVSSETFAHAVMTAIETQSDSQRRTAADRVKNRLDWATIREDYAMFTRSLNEADPNMNSVRGADGSSH